MRSKAVKRLTAIYLAIVFLMSFPCAACAQGESAAKEEIVYAKLAHDGSMAELYVVNAFDMKQAGTIIDHGDYSYVTNMSTTDAISCTDKTVTVSVPQGRFYYEGGLNGAVLPWEIAFSYAMDDLETEAPALAGKSGAFALTISVRKNLLGDQAFFRSMALQITVTIDASKCSDIVAEEATVANAGSKKQITFTILPGKEKDLTLRANVQDFEMDGIQVAAVPLSFAIAADASGFTDDINQLVSAIGELDDGAAGIRDGTGALAEGIRGVDDGAKKLNKGIGQYADGVFEFSGGASRLSEGANSLAEGSLLLNAGIDQYISGVDAYTRGVFFYTDGVSQLADGIDAAYAGAGELAAGSAQIKEGMEELAGVMAPLEEYAQKLDDAVDSINNVLDKLNEFDPGRLNGLADAIRENEELMAIPEIYNLLEAYETAINQLPSIDGLTRTDGCGLGDLMDQLSQLSEMVSGLTLFGQSYGQFHEGLVQLESGLGELSQGADELDDAGRELRGGGAKLSDGGTKLSTSADEFVRGQIEFSTGVSEIGDGANQLYDGALGLKEGSSGLSGGISKIRKGADELEAGTQSFSEGMGDLRAGTVGMDDSIQEAIDGIIADITGVAYVPKSFVSTKNTSVKSVQFVMMTDPISIQDEKNAASVEPVQLTLWQRILKLFGLYNN